MSGEQPRRLTDVRRVRLEDRLQMAIGLLEHVADELRHTRHERVRDDLLEAVSKVAGAGADLIRDVADTGYEEV